MYRRLKNYFLIPGALIAGAVGCAPMGLNASARTMASIAPSDLSRVRAALNESLKCVEAANVGLLTRGLSPARGEPQRAVIQAVKSNCIELKAVFEEKALLDAYVETVSDALEPLQARRRGVVPTRLTLLSADLSFAKARREQGELAQKIELIKERLTEAMGLTGFKASWSIRRGILAMPKEEINFQNLEDAASKNGEGDSSIAKIRQSALKMWAARQSFDYTQRLILPLAGRMDNEARRDFAAEPNSALEFIDAAKSLYEAKKEILERLKNYWIARTELEAAAGGLNKSAN